MVNAPDVTSCDKGSGFVASMPAVLRWSDGVEVLRRIHDSYVEQLSDRLGVALRRMHDEDPARAALVENDLREVSDEAFLRVLTAPETSFRLLGRRSPLTEVGAYLHRSFLAEAVAGGRPIPLEGESWTALGDRCVLPDGGVRGLPPLGGRIALDLDSPQVANVDITGRRRRAFPLPVEVRADTLAHIDMAQRGVAAASSHIADVVATFIKVLVLQRDADDVYGSGSCQQYIGRAVLANPHLIDEIRIAEAMVHEAVHSVLYMQLESYPWGLVDFRTAQEPRVISPWSGKRLLLSAYLHACFVWYALVHFWALALQRNAFAAERVIPRLARATVGFQSGPLMSALDEASQSLVLPAVHNAIDDMQALVLDAM